MTAIFNVSRFEENRREQSQNQTAPRFWPGRRRDIRSSIWREQCQGEFHRVIGSLSFLLGFDVGLPLLDEDALSSHCHNM